MANARVRGWRKILTREPQSNPSTSLAAYGLEDILNRSLSEEKLTRYGQNHCIVYSRSLESLVYTPYLGIEAY